MTWAIYLEEIENFYAELTSTLLAPAFAVIKTTGKYNDIFLRTHGPYHRHKSTKSVLLYISTHYRNGVST